MMNPFLQVAVGGAIGSVARYGIGRITLLRGSGFPVATVVVNVSGSFVMGVLVALLAHRGGQNWAPFLLTGMLGGYTTFSAFSLDAMTLWERGQLAGMMLYVIGSVALSLLAVMAGLAAGRELFA